MFYRLFQGSVKARIFLSCGILLLLCVLSSLLGLFGQNVLLRNFERYEKTERKLADALEIDRDVQELKARSESYLQSGARSQFDTASQLQKGLLSRIEHLQDEIDNVEVDEVSQEMRLHIESFGEKLSLAAEERRIRKSLVQEQLPEQEILVQESFKRLRASLGTAGEVEATSSLLSAEQSFTDAGGYLLQYFVQPRTSQYELMLSSLQRTKSTLQKVAAGNVSSIKDVDGLRDSLVEAIAQFEQLATRAIQATRGYLFYSNVVMAGEVSEFVYYSNRLKDAVSEQQRINREARSDAVRRIRLYSFLGSVIAIFAGGLLATRLSYQTVGPISELTRTFQRLSRGETVDHIDATRRTDELGRMALAAKVFSDKNRETRELLERANALSQELESQAQALQDSNEDLDQFAYVASHDLKSPLRGITHLAQWVKEDCYDLISEDSKDHLDKMQARTKQMEGLLDDLLNYSRVGRIEEKLELVDTNELVESIVELTDLGSVQVNAVGKLPTLTTARGPIQQVLLNLIANAVKYNDKGNDGSVRIWADEVENFVRFHVSDNGVGIDPKQHDRVFKMYQRVSSMNVEGTGMGLAIIKKQVESFGGEITLESEIGKGSTFSFTWPKECD